MVGVSVALGFGLLATPVQGLAEEALVPDAAAPAAPARGSAIDADEQETDELDLGGGWNLDFGGQLRYRFMDEDNRALTGASPRKDDFHLWRTLLRTDLVHEDGLRVRVEGVDARRHGGERPALPIDRNDLDILNGYAEWEGEAGSVRLGRTELLEGAQRLVSPLEWGNTRRTFDGGLVRLDHGEGSRTHLFATRPVIVDVHHSDNRDTGRYFSGVYHTTEAGDTTWDLFALALNELDDVLLADDGSPGDMDLYTLGARWKEECGPLDYELWGARQVGHRAGDRIDAYAWSVRVGLKVPDAPGSPRIGLDVDYASGDSSPGDGELETFNQLFPLGHAYLGYLDLIGRQNIVDVSPNATFQVASRTKLRAAWHAFRLAESEDALYNAGGAAMFADPTGSAGRDVGDELDLTLTHVPDWLDRRSTILVGWSRFYAGDHIDDLGGNGDADLFYLQLTLSF